MLKKSRTLALATKQAIWRYKKKNPTATIGEIADYFSCSYDQARNAVEQGKKGDLVRSKPKNEDFYEASDDPDAIFEAEFARIATALSEGDIDFVASRTAILKDLVVIKKGAQQVRLQNHMKKNDADLVAAIVRRFLPEATDEEVIAIYHECREIANMKREAND